MYGSSFSTSALGSGEQSVSRPGCFTPRGWVSPRAGLDEVDNILNPVGFKIATLQSSSPQLLTSLPPFVQQYKIKKRQTKLL
jgi:hypothetical protein